MGGEVILVAVDASNGISSDYAIEWAIQNVTKPGDLLILLALLPSPTSNLYQRLQYSLACYFLSCEFFTFHHLNLIISVLFFLSPYFSFWQCNVHW